MLYTVYGWYLACMNLLAFSLCGVDKLKARRNRWRIPETTLFLVSGVGGAWGFLAGMMLFRHKTRKAKFVVGVPVMLVIHCVIVAVIVIELLRG